MRYELKSISSWSYIKVMFFVNLIIGFVLGVFAGIFSGVFMSIAAGLMFFSEDAIDVESGFPIVIYIFAMGIMFSLGNAVFGTLFGAIIVGFYNLIVRMTGGLEFILKPMANAGSVIPIDTPASQESLTAEPLKPKYVVPPPPPPPQSSSPPPSASPAAPEPPPAPKETEKDNDRFKPPDYLSNE